MVKKVYQHLVIIFLALRYHCVCGNVTAFTSYGVVFPPLDPSVIIPKLDPDNATYKILTLCEIWENDSIPITPGIEVALLRIRPHFTLKNIEIRTLRRQIPRGCGDASMLAIAPTLVKMHYVESVTGCSLIIGPSCSETMYNIRGLVMDWDIPVVTSGASAINFEDKKRTTVLTRFGYTQEDVSMFVIQILDHFNWKNTVLIHDTDSYATDFQTTFQQVLRSRRIDLYKKIDFMPLLQGSDAQWLNDQLTKANEKSRVFILAAMPPVVYEILVAAEKLGMTGPGYVFMTTNLIETRSHGFSDLTYFDEKGKTDPAARALFDSLLVVRMKLPSDDVLVDDFDQFQRAIKIRSRDRYNYTYPPGEQVTHLVLGIWDAVMFYAVAVNNSLYNGESISSGKAITAKIWGHSFMGVAIECTISTYGDRNFPYFLLDYDITQTSFRPVIFLDNEQLVLIDLKPIHWPGNSNIPPPNAPRCGFTGKEQMCQETVGIPLYGTVLIAILCLGVFLTVLGYGLYRSRISKLNNNLWKIKGTDVTPREDRRPKIESLHSLKDGQNKDDARTLPSSSRLSSQAGDTYIATAIYKETVVAVKELGDDTVHLSSETLWELQTLCQMVHEHLTRFYGLCQDLEKPFLLTEHCSKGSLADLIEAETVNLDWAFKYSLINDIVEGLLYVHNSPMRSHGRITSNNCLVDGRFVVKIGDLGLSAIRPSTVTLQRSVQYAQLAESNQALRMLLWRAPEHLRSPMPPNGSKKGDIYSFGIILQELSQRQGPYERMDAIDGHNEQLDVAEIVSRVRERLIPPYRPRVPFDACPPELYSIMLRCWSEMPSDRYEPDQLRSQLKRVPGNKSVNLMDDLLKRMEKYAKDLEELVNERTSAFMDEKKRSEDLLYQMLPRAVANKLKQGLYVEPETFESVSIYFSDIVGFTTLSATSTPMEVVDLLNDLYTLFDGVIEAHDVYKVETIGDAYVVVSGLPQRNERRHASEIARMSLHIVAAISVFTIRHKQQEKLAIRIGINSGPCAAGVVGLKMPRYCIFGDSVNIASRLETTGEAMKIHVSIATKKLLEGFIEFLLELRGEVDLKGRGSMETFWLLPSSESLMLGTPHKSQQGAP